MRLETEENPNPRRKPDNWEETFADGDFADFIKPIVDTLDLYHNQSVDPRAIAISFKQLAENHPEAELEIVAVEKRGQDKFLLRAKTVEVADHSKLSEEYFSTYNQLKALAEREIQALIAEKDIRIRSLENMVLTALQSPSFYAQTYQGDFMPDQRSETASINQKGNFGVGVNQGEIKTGKLARIINEAQRKNLAEVAEEIQQLLKQLEETNLTTTELEKVTVAAKAAEEIKKNPTLKAWVISALKSGGTEAFKEAVDNPLVNILVAIIEGWTEAE